MVFKVMDARGEHIGYIWGPMGSSTNFRTKKVRVIRTFLLLGSAQLGTDLPNILGIGLLGWLIVALLLGYLEKLILELLIAIPHLLKGLTELLIA